MNEKPLGYGLIVFGIVMIFFAAFSVFQVFTGASKPYPLFRFPSISLDLGKIAQQQAMNALPANIQLPEGIDLSRLLQNSNESNGIPKQVQDDKSNTQEIISAEMVNAPMNLFAHVFLMGFLASAGAKIATIGTYLVRTIEVKVKESAQTK